MHRDTYGNPVKTGDVVLVRFSVVATHPGELGDNLSLLAIEWDSVPGVLPIGTRFPEITVNSQLVRKQGAGEGADDGR